MGTLSKVVSFIPKGTLGQCPGELGVTIPTPPGACPPRSPSTDPTTRASEKCAPQALALDWQRSGEALPRIRKTLSGPSFAR